MLAPPPAWTLLALLALLIGCGDTKDAASPDEESPTGETSADTGADTTSRPDDATVSTTSPGDTAPVGDYEARVTIVYAGEVLADGAALDLGEVPIGIEGPTARLVITNPTDATLQLGEPESWLTGAGFTWDTTPSGTLDPSSSVEALLRFTPTAEGDHEGALTLSADGWTSPYALSLHGGGQPPPRILWIGNYGRSILSDDYGETWFNDTVGAGGENINGGVWAEGLFVTAGGDSTGLYRTSADGITWEETRGTRNTIYAIAYGDGRFVSAGSFGNLAWSTDGRTWFEEHYDSNTHLRNLAYGDGRFVSVGGERRAITLDGVSWEHDQYYSGTELYGLAYGNGVFVATGTEGLIATTADGVTWTEQTVGTDDRYEVAFIDGLFVTADWPDGTYTSPDGVTWSRVSENYDQVSCMAGEWAMGDSWVDALMRSTDGYTWEVTKPSEYDSWEYSFSFCIVQGVE